MSRRNGWFDAAMIVAAGVEAAGIIYKEPCLVRAGVSLFFGAMGVCFVRAVFARVQVRARRTRHALQKPSTAATGSARRSP